RSISRIKSSSRHEVTILNPVFCCSEIWGCDKEEEADSDSESTASNSPHTG
ncbi:hypothetical protein Tco_0392228, partial [Tanacetum coccineum]